MRAPLAFVLLFAASCTPAPQDWPNTFAGDGEDYFALDDDFTCLEDERFTLVDEARYVNLLGHDEEMLEVARLQRDPEGAAGVEFPVGTLVQQFADEAMIKRGRGFSPDTNDWEFLQLHVDASGTIIRARGTTDMKNVAGTCMSCHEPARRFDVVCAENRACNPLPFFVDTDVTAPTEDPRCVD